MRKGAPEWIGSDAAVVRCTVAGPNLRPPLLFDELPSPAVPTGLYARAMDPMALDQLGYERDRAVCASLQAPTTAELASAAEAIDELRRLRREVARRVGLLGPCRCTYAAALDAEGLVDGCSDAPTDQSCEATGEKVEALAELLAPLRAQLERTQVPRLHWRLAGRTDRIGRFVARHDDLVARHLGGSEVYLQGTPLPPRHGTALIRKLLTVEGVVAVVRQDGGRALLVVRELDDQLILDHFAYPSWGEIVDPAVYPLLPYLDDAQVERYRKALAPPAKARELLLDPREGYLVELDRAALERVDRGQIVATQFAGRSYDDSREQRVLPPLLVDRLAFQVPFGTEGKALRMHLRLTDAGRRWVGAVDGVELADALTSLGQIDVTPSYRPARPGFEQMFLLRGTPVDELLFAGPSALPQVLAAVEAAHPGSLDGDIDDWQAELPSGPMPGDFPSREGIRELRERLSIDEHRLEGELVEGGRVIAVELERR